MKPPNSLESRSDRPTAVHYIYDICMPDICIYACRSDFIHHYIVNTVAYSLCSSWDERAPRKATLVRSAEKLKGVWGVHREQRGPSLSSYQLLVICQYPFPNPHISPVLVTSVYGLYAMTWGNVGEWNGPIRLPYDNHILFHRNCAAMRALTKFKKCAVLVRVDDAKPFFPTRRDIGSIRHL